MDKKTARWIAAVLANDEVSSDAELLAYLVENGLPEHIATAAIAKRTQYLR
jgi:hypothetical protein